MKWVSVTLRRNLLKRKHDGQKRNGKDKKAKTTRPDVTCLKCGLTGHYMSKCPQKPSKEEQELLLKKHRAKASMKTSDNKPSKSTYVFVSRIESSQCNDSISVDVKTANEHLVFRGILDSGADATIVPMKFAQRILEVDSSVTMSKLDTPIIVELPNGSKDKISYEMYMGLGSAK